MKRNLILRNCLLLFTGVIIFLAIDRVMSQSPHTASPVYNSLPFLIYILVPILFWSYILWFVDMRALCLDKCSKPIYHAKVSLIILLTLVVSDLVRIEEHPKDDLYYLAIFGTILAVVSWREAFEQNKEINDISNSLPTRYIGEFPDHLNEIIKLVERSQTKFCIMTDCVDYGSFSNPELHDKMVKAIETAKTDRKVDVQILLCDDAQPISRGSQFRSKWLAGWSVLYADREFRKCLQQYFEFNPEYAPFRSKINGQGASKHIFKKMLMSHHAKIYSNLKAAHIPIYDWEYEKNVPEDERVMTGLFFWMVDDIEAVFLLSNTGMTAPGLAFQTRNTKLIEICKSTFNLSCAKIKRIDNRRNKGAVKSAQTKRV
jgi:hypothetical protein